MRLSILAGLAFLFASIAVHSEEGNAPTMPSFSDVDTNQDLYVDETEFQAFIETAREQAGFEGQAGRRPPMGFGGRRGGPFKMADADGDGVLNEQEYYDLLIRMEEMRERFRGRMQDRSE